MMLSDGFIFWFTFMILGKSFCLSGISFNQPKLYPRAAWNPNAITFANSITIGTSPYDIFINKNNTIYIPNRNRALIPNSTLIATLTVVHVSIYSFKHYKMRHKD